MAEFPERYKVLGADLSLKRPSFCVLSVRKENGETHVKIRKMVTVDNKLDKKKNHGQLLDDIMMAFSKLIVGEETMTFYVRENEIMKVKVPSERSLSKVVGLMDWSLWKFTGNEWFSIYPMTVKKLVAGSGKAKKEEVAAALEKYLGKYDYKCDDESDAAAVALAWLIQQGEVKEIVE